ncbi:MAG: hypothetical protein ACKOX3_04185, partial [Bacteroidota bacterium]
TIILTFLFFLCIADAAQFEEGTLITQSSQIKHEFIGAITFIARLLGDGIFNNSSAFDILFIPISIAINAYLLSVITKICRTIYRGATKNFID